MALPKTTCHKCHEDYSGPWHTCAESVSSSSSSGFIGGMIPLTTTEPPSPLSAAGSSYPSCPIYTTCARCGMAFPEGFAHICTSSLGTYPGPYGNEIVSTVSLTEVSDRSYNALWARCDDLDLATARLEAKIDKLTQVLTHLLEKL